MARDRIGLKPLYYSVIRIGLFCILVRIKSNRIIKYSKHLNQIENHILSLLKTSLAIPADRTGNKEY